MEDLEKKIEDGIDWKSEIREADLFQSINKYVHGVAQVNNTIDLDAIYKGATEFIKSEAAKEYWQQGMYTEKEMKELTNQAYLNGIKDIGLDKHNEWFEQNKKKQ